MRVNYFLFLLIFFNGFIGFSQAQTSVLKVNRALVPQSIDYDGKPELEYTIKDKIIALDSYDEKDQEGVYIRMKFKGEEVRLKMVKQSTSKSKRVFSNSEYKVTFYELVYGECSGEGGQYFKGKLLIQSKTEQNTIPFEGSDGFYSSKKCQEEGNG